MPSKPRRSRRSIVPVAGLVALLAAVAACSASSSDSSSTAMGGDDGGSALDAGPDASKPSDAQAPSHDAGNEATTSGNDASVEAGVGGIGAILTESMFDSMFPNRDPIYTYAALVQAAASYPSFATTGSADDQKREVAGFLANVAHETGELVYVNEIAQAAYCSSSPDCPCAAGQEYFGRGSLQLSWNYNYCAAGQALGQNLQANPGLVATDSTLAWGTGLWFWMTSTGAGSQTCHDGIRASGFGATIQTINGSIECNGGAPSSVQDRVQFYTTYCSTFGVSPGSNTSC